jgi:glycosyltransferase involved in cell wall biosynthesis
MSKSRISIALATYNGRRFLEEQLISLAQQTRAPDEIVICDDHSTDDTVAILTQFQARTSIPMRIHRNEERLGYAKNFEKAISACEGDLIFLCDQDDVWHASKLEKHEAVYTAEPDVGLILNNARFIDDESKVLSGTQFDHIFGRNPKMFDVLQSDRAFAFLTRTWRVFGCMTSFRAQYWDLVKPIPEGLGHDDWLALSMSLLSRIRVISDPLNDYRRHPQQVTRDTSLIDGEVGDYTPMFVRLMEKRAIELARIKLRVKALEKRMPLRFPSHQDHLKGLMSHLWRRAAMTKRLSQRLPLVLTELLLDNYRRYNDNLRDCLSQDLRQGRFL